MASLTHEERVLRMCRSIYAGRDVTPKWAAECCGISTAEFEGYYSQYINRLCYAIQHKQEWFILCELRFLLISGYMRPDEASKRFKVPQEGIEKWIEEQGGINENLSWRDMRMIRVKEREQEEKQDERLNI